MVLATVIMNMVYLTVETRTRVGEPGINDPNTKMIVTSVTFMALLLLVQNDVIDPSTSAVPSPNATTPAYKTNYTDTSLPLRNVCKLIRQAPLGSAIFFAISFFCLAFVIFVTSAQTLSGLRSVCGCCCCCCRCCLRRWRVPPLGPSSSPSKIRRLSVRNPAPVSRENVSLPIQRLSAADRIQGQLLLFLIYLLLVLFIVLFFATVPLYQAAPPLGMQRALRNDALWRRACDEYDVAALTRLGLS